MSGLINGIRLVAGLIDRINEFFGQILAWLALLLVLNVFMVVVLRYLFSSGDVWMQETYIWMHAFVFMLGAGFTLLHDGHVRIDLIYSGASDRYKAFVNFFGSIFLAAPVLWLIYARGMDFFYRSFSRLETSPEAGGLPALYILKGVIPALAIFLGLQVFSMAIRSLDTIITGERVRLVEDEDEPLT
jgi:TRAP-type mannitol/chloroaromatic compound transport system permease small subunit